MSLELPDFNRTLHDGVLGIIGSINIEGVPVGGILSKIIGLLWKGPDESKAMWDSIRQYAEDLAKDEIDKERIETLNKRLAGLASIAWAYRNTSMSSEQKSGYLTSMIAILRTFEQDFWDSRNPQKMFPLYGSFGTLWIGCLFDQAFNFKEIYKQDDPDAQAHLDEFRSNVRKYVAGGQAIYDRLYEARFRKLEMTEWQSKSPKIVGIEFVSTWTFTDHYDGYTKHASEGALNDSSFHGPAARKLMERELRDRVFNINSDYVKGLQETLAIAQWWQYLEPHGMRPMTHLVVDDEGPWGGDRNLAQDFEDRAALGGRITRIEMRTGAFIEGLRLSYDGEPAAWHGNTERGEPRELVLDDDEYIVEVSGMSTSLIEHLAFRTSKNRVIDGGTSVGTPFSASGRPGWKQTALHSVSGWTDGKRVTGLKLHWRHLADLPPYVPSYKKTAPLPLATAIRLRSQDGKFISAFEEKYSGKAAANEYFPKMGDHEIDLQFLLASGGTTLSDHDAVQVRTSETGAGDYNLLSRFTSIACYYYLQGYGDKQLWTVIKVIPSDGPVLLGDKIFLRNVDACCYLSIDDSGYVTGDAAPHVWEVVAA